MLCQSCGKNTATTHVKTIINGALSEYALCPECAKKLGYADLFGDWGFNFGALLGTLFPQRDQEEDRQEPEQSQAGVCGFCGSTFEDIVRTGKVGCANCYKVFYSRLSPSIRRIHGNAVHQGKKPGSAAMILRPKNEIRPVESELEIKQKELEKAIQEQNFEYAAVLRDEIKLLKEERSNG